MPKHSLSTGYKFLLCAHTEREGEGLVQCGYTERSECTSTRLDKLFPLGWKISFMLCRESLSVNILPQTSADATDGQKWRDTVAYCWYWRAAGTKRAKQAKSWKHVTVVGWSNNTSATVFSVLDHCGPKGRTISLVSRVSKGPGVVVCW